MSSEHINVLHTELLRFQNAVTELLSSIKHKIESLPADRDLRENTEKINQIIRDLTNLSHTWDKYINEFHQLTKCTDQSSSQIDKLYQKVNEISDMINNLNTSLQTISSSMGETSKLMKQINTIHDLANRVNNELLEMETVLKNKNAGISLHDMHEVIRHAKRSNERHDNWQGWKGIVAIAIGVVMGLGIIISGFAELANNLLKYFF